MKRVQRISMAVLLMMGLGVGYLALRNRQPPILPNDADHLAPASPVFCLPCHGPQSALPQSSNHPLGDDCRRCHGVP